MKALLLFLLLSSVLFSEDIKGHLVSVQHSAIRWSMPPQLQTIEGSGICIKRDCSVVVTAAHIQMLASRAMLRVDTADTEKVVLLADASDTDKATVPIRVSGSGKNSISYRLSNDIAFIYTTRPVHRKSGIAYSFQSHVGQRVRIAGYYK